METIEYYYALASPWSFLGNQKLIEIADAHNLQIDPIIIDYDEMFAAAKTVPLPDRPTLRKKYRLVDLRRWAAFRGVTFNAEPKFYQGEVEEPNERDGALMVVAAKEAGLDSLKLAHAISRALWAEERSRSRRTNSFGSLMRKVSMGKDSLRKRKTVPSMLLIQRIRRNPSNAMSSACRSISCAGSPIGAKIGWN